MIRVQRVLRSVGVVLFAFLFFVVLTACNGGGGAPPGASAHPAIMPSTTPPGNVGVPYNVSFRWTSNTVKPPFFWNLVGSMPPGTAFDAVNGLIAGTPTTQGSYAFTITVRDSNNPQNQESQAYTIVIGGPTAGPLTLTPAVGGALGPGKVGFPYSAQMFATGGLYPYLWTIKSGWLPPGLSLNGANGVISGTPTTAGTFNFVANVADSQVPPSNASQAFSITIIEGFSVLTPSPLPPGEINVAYSATLSADGGVSCGTPAYKWAFESGTLPPGLSVGAAGNVTGTPTAAGAYDFVVVATDCEPGPTGPETARASLHLVIALPLSVSTSVLPDAYVTVPYSQPLSVSGGVGPFVWDLVDKGLSGGVCNASGPLPPELILNTDGTLSGTPLIADTTGYNLCVAVMDANGKVAYRQLLLRVLQDVALCVDGINGDDSTGDGTTIRPFKTITRALTYTSANNTDASKTLPRIGAIRVAGSAPPLLYNESITLDASATVRTDVNLLGGYTAFCATRGAVPNARIKGLANFSPTVTTLGLTRSTWIELLEIDGNDALSGISYAIANSFNSLGNSSSPTIARNVIRAGNPSGSGATSFGIYNSGSGNALNPTSPLIVENTIYGGTGADGTFGVADIGWGVTSASSEIRDNTIDGGDPSGGGVTTSAGVKSYSGAIPWIYDNVITGGTGASAYGVWVGLLAPADANIARNVINCKGKANGSSAICAGIYVASGIALSSPISANSVNENRAETGNINALGVSTRGVWLNNGSSATLLGNNVVYGGEGTTSSYGVLAENTSTVTVGDIANTPGGANTINGGGCALNGTFDSFGIKASSGSTANVWFNTINGGCGTNSSTGVGIDGVAPAATGNLDTNTINGGGVAGTTKTSRGVWYENSIGSITNNHINGGNGLTCYAKQVIGPSFPSPETGNTYICGGKNSYGLWLESCPPGYILQNENIYGGDPTGPPPTTSTGLKLKNCNAEVKNDTIDGGSGMTATGIDVDPSSPNIHNNGIEGSRAANTTILARGVWYHGSSGGTFGGPAFSGNSVVGAVGSSPANPTDSVGLLVDDNSVPAVQSNTINGGQGGTTIGVYITGGANPALNGNAIGGGAGTFSTYGVKGLTLSWTAVASVNTISGGTCPGCSSTGILVNGGTPTIGPNNQIDGGIGRNTIGLDLEPGANPTITANTSISGGAAINSTIGIDGDSASWNAPATGNTVSGGNCPGCDSTGILIETGAPTVGGALPANNNKIDGGTAQFTIGVSVGGAANPTITGNNASITGGTATLRSVGIYWNSTVGGTISNNKVLGGTSCNAAPCSSEGIVVPNGTPLITGNPLIQGGTAFKTYGIHVDATGNPGITANVSIDGGMSNGAGGAVGVTGETGSWVGVVTNNTISGGGCSVACAGGTNGFTLGIGAPVVTNNVITAGTYANRLGAGFGFVAAIATFTGNSVTGGAGTGYDIYDVRGPFSGFINGTGTTMSAPIFPFYGPPGTRAICSTWIANPIFLEILGDNAAPFDSKLAGGPPNDSTAPLWSPGAAFAPAGGPPVFTVSPGPELFIFAPGNCIQF